MFWGSKLGLDLELFSRIIAVSLILKRAENPGVLRGFPGRDLGNRSTIRAYLGYGFSEGRAQDQGSGSTLIDHGSA